MMAYSVYTGLRFEITAIQYRLLVEIAAKRMIGTYASRKEINNARVLFRNGLRAS